MAISFETVTIMRSGALGDIVLTLPAVSSVKKSNQDSSLHLIFPKFISELTSADYFTDVGGIPVSALYIADSEIPHDLRKLLAKTHLLLAYSTDSNFLESRLQQLTDGKVVVWDPRPPTGYDQHITKHLLQPLQNLGVSTLGSKVELCLPDGKMLSNHLKTRQRVIVPSRKVIALHPGSSNVSKCWPPEKFSQLIRLLVDVDLNVILLLGPVEKEHFQQFTRGITTKVDIVMPSSVAQLAIELRNADLFVGNDSGPGHLAAAVGTTTLSLFGPTNPNIWGPIGSKAHILIAQGGDLKKMDVETVFDSIFEILEQQ